MDDFTHNCKEKHSRLLFLYILVDLKSQSNTRTKSCICSESLKMTGSLLFLCISPTAMKNLLVLITEQQKLGERKIKRERNEKERKRERGSSPLFN